MSSQDQWGEQLEQANLAADFSERAAKRDIMSDPKAQYSPPPVRNYPTTENHRIICVDEENGNLSMPEAEELYGTDARHKIGGITVSDRLHCPMGWIVYPRAGTLIESIKDAYPELYEKYTEKKIEKF